MFTSRLRRGKRKSVAVCSGVEHCTAAWVLLSSMQRCHLALLPLVLRVYTFTVQSTFIANNNGIPSEKVSTSMCVKETVLHLNQLVGKPHCTAYYC
jgi:hypothetical protein